jgi:phosphatidylglycerol:prolipoprotein diacylglycerol transferase
VQSIAFKFGSHLTVHWYGILVACGFLAGLWTSSIRAKRTGVSPERVFDFGPWLILGGIVGGRVLYVISYWKEYFASDPFPEIFMIQNGGLVFYGGLMGAILVGIIYLRLKKMPMWKMADIMAPGISLGYFFGRFGCLMNGCCFGRECHLPWAITYPEGHETHPRSPVPGIPTSAIPVHPTQIYDSLLNLGFYFLLNHFFYRRKFDGQILALYLMGYAVLRAFVEYFRGDYPVHYLGGIATPAQLISVVILAAGITLYLVLKNRPPYVEPATVPATK